MSPRQVVLLATGGTIACVAAHADDLVDYGDSGVKLSARELLARIGDPGRVVSAEDIGLFDSNALTAADWAAMRDAIVAASGPERRGVVLTHGTATLEDTALFLSLTLPRSIPVVLTGSQRPWDVPGADAPANLADAIRVAARLPGGVAVVMNGLVHGAREVTKAGTYELDAFSSRPGAPAGSVDAHGVVHLRACAGAEAAEGAEDGVPPLGAIPDVPILSSYLGSDGALIAAARQHGAAGIVVEAFAPGIVTPGELDEIAACCARGIPVVVASRSRRGRVLVHGGLAATGAISAGELSGHKARVALAAALALGEDPARFITEIAR